MTASALDEATGQARFVFLGTVVRLNAATEAAIPLASNMAIVRVEDVLRAPPALGEQAGREITVQLREAEAAQEGQRAVFFTNPWLYGDSLAVLEVDRREAQALGALREQVQSASQQEDDEALRERLGTSELVVVGTVVNTRPLAQGQTLRGSEHDPQWWEATIAVEAVEKGALQDPTVAVVFAASMDVLWFQAPKARVGQDGIWLLHRQPIQDMNVTAYAVVDPLDVLQRDQLARVRRLQGGGQAT